MIVTSKQIKKRSVHVTIHQKITKDINGEANIVLSQIRNKLSIWCISDTLDVRIMKIKPSKINTFNAENMNVYPKKYTIYT